MHPNAYGVYKNNSVNFASKDQMLLMLLDGAVKFGNTWAIPRDAKRPKDQRVKSGKYERSLNLDEAVCRTEFESNGVHYRRTMFLSHPEDCLIMHFTANAEAKISFQANLSRGKYFDGKQKLGENGICLYGNLGKGGNDFAMGMKAWAKGGQVQVVGCSLCVSSQATMAA